MNTIYKQQIDTIIAELNTQGPFPQGIRRSVMVSGEKETAGCFTGEFYGLKFTEPLSDQQKKIIGNGTHLEHEYVVGILEDTLEQVCFTAIASVKVNEANNFKLGFQFLSGKNQFNLYQDGRDQGVTPNMDRLIAPVLLSPDFPQSVIMRQNSGGYLYTIGTAATAAKYCLQWENRLGYFGHRTENNVRDLPQHEKSIVQGILENLQERMQYCQHIGVTTQEPSINVFPDTFLNVLPEIDPQAQQLKLEFRISSM